MSRWHMLVAQREEFIHKLERASDDRDTIVEQMAAVDEVLLNEPGPDAAATLFKLELLWEGKTEGDHEDAKRKQLILSELRSALLN